MMEAASTSETSAKFYQTTRRNNSEDSHFHTRRRQNLKSHDSNKSYTYEEFKSSLNSGNTYYHLVQNVLFSYLSEHLKD
jgi:hypothetical protein